MTTIARPNQHHREEVTQRRRALQYLLDRKRSKEERNRLGQFATPDQLALDVAQHALSYFPDRSTVEVLEPAVGLGSLWEALLKKAEGRDLRGTAFEVDSEVAQEARSLWGKLGLVVNAGNFTSQLPPAPEEQFDLLISNPPYVRHHHLDQLEKKHLRRLAESRSGVQPNGYMGLYGYFMLLAHSWIKPGGIGVWLIPTEFMDVGYGKALKEYLLKQVTLLSIHTFTHTTTQFDDALVSSAIVTYRMTPVQHGHEVRFTSGDQLLNPANETSWPIEDLTADQKWSGLSLQHEVVENRGITLGDLFDVRRGIATGDNTYFVMDEQQADALKLPKKYLRPVLPSPRHLKSDHILGRDDGFPALDTVQVLLDCDLPPDHVREQFPELWAYLQEGKQRGVSARYLCEKRNPWYRQEQRPPPLFLCTYMGRGRAGGNPFRFILNESQATATNVYLLLYPKGEMASLLTRGRAVQQAVWEELNALGGEVVKREGRVYGGGLHKVEPSELLKTPAETVLEVARYAINGAA
ncbi:Eco57I restriction-modification methylase domain-containing protein [Deinococcus wulumuqiensis]|uniref:site-specific DNA-methyltransferase (adenine-specific) n=1 Tax=Deinococcus wulumuqiensis TaxID=980427 RepID=A0AAV4K8C1_9DEIO|nr:Eco57I restriction-modification methylase domain-containing protein [Deinococcus wulumuqiensis]QII22321.1 SAM-dependent DNA methyltransferase [Deinococcus wulumuqiensis R12]GGI69499.1 hypothetical protein GCM10008021_32020 [Deinococcus wulumuqiensis]GGI95089.1 hypothetical protein GCM10010914_31970 [Deinococcus wulumuqiensis]